ncbi:MAG: transposase [Rubrivivax sp.]|nr:transposase [Rubrivivax sp.]
MARLPRLEIAGQAHLVIQRSNGGQAAFADRQDRQAFVAALREAAAAAKVQVHAYALLGTEVQLLLTPAERGALGRAVQALGRRYVSAYNRRHGRAGTLWDGRFRAAVMEPGPTRLAALQAVDAASSEPGFTSAGHRTGAGRDPMLVDPPEFWQLGNTPFERDAAYRARLAEGVAPAVVEWLRQAALGGWAAGSEAFAAEVAAAAARPARPRPRGRPRKAANRS